MSERFPDEVLQRAIAAYLPEKVEAEAIAAMRAVLEAYLREIESTVRQQDAVPQK